MTIKEVEQALEIPRATIRFYEKEKLITPSRNGNAYREYSNEDIAVLKKVIVLRKIGLSVADIKELLDEKASLQEVIEKNVADLQERIKELDGAIKICKKIQFRQEDINSFDETYYWEEIQVQEKAGSRFLDIVNDTIKYEKKIILKQFNLADRDGNLSCGKIEALRNAIGICIATGIVNCLLTERTIEEFIDGFLLPFKWILVYSIFGLPLYFLGKKYPKAAKVIKWIGIGIFLLILFLLIVLSVYN
ncbi:MAG: MerR family transcriptional regulator [Lachnospiraceae bacterium]|nr:MerR family transcriptional regulator [Lachnospiraceae bacterium]MEE1257779.1 MerR family transcriptional regulator [Lachnospiraceae bacterium]